MVASLLFVGLPTPGAAALEPAFPRLAIWWGSSSTANLSLGTFCVPWGDPLKPVPSALASLRLRSPGLLLLGAASAAQLDYSPAGDRAYDEQRLGAIPNAWLLKQVGSTLTSALSAGDVTVHVADAGRFRVKDLVVVEEERCVVTGIGQGTLTVRRGWAGSVAVPHGQGSRIAAAASDWPFAVTLNMTAECPLDAARGEFATPAGTTESAADWLARVANGIYRRADWDGLFIDLCLADYSSGFRGTTSLRTIADVADPTSEVDYASFDLRWQAGIESYLARVRTLTGPDAILLTNAAPPVFGIANGTLFEGFPARSTTTERWYQDTIGPTSQAYKASYVEWGARSAAPNLTAMLTFGEPTDYAFMRFGLCTALMGDGYYAYERSSGYANGYYDEYDGAGAGKGYLGQPLGPAHAATPVRPDLLSGDGTFDSPVEYNAWTLSTSGPVVATKSADAGTCLVNVTTPGADWRLSLTHPVKFVAGRTYRVTFSAKASAPVEMRSRIEDSSNGGAYYPGDQPWLSDSWRTFTVAVTATKTGNGKQSFYFGDFRGTVWFDDITVRQTGPEVWRRDFTGGIALVNPTTGPVTLSLGTTFRKMKGRQDPGVNNGTTLSSVTVPARDGLVLLRIPVLRATNTSVTYGRETTLEVAVQVPFSGSVRIEQRAGGASAWQNVAAVTPDNDGRVALTRTPLVTTEYRAILVDDGPVSNTVKVGVRPIVALRASRTSTRRWAAVTLSGTVSHPGRVPVLLQRRVGGHWKTVRRLATSSAGRYSTRVSFSRRGTMVYRAYVAADTSHLAAGSGTIKIAVR